MPYEHYLKRGSGHRGEWCLRPRETEPWPSIIAEPSFGHISIASSAC